MKLGSLIKDPLAGCEPWRSSAPSDPRCHKASQNEKKRSCVCITDCDTSNASPVAEECELNENFCISMKRGPGIPHNRNHNSLIIISFSSSLIKLFCLFAFNLISKQIHVALICACKISDFQSAYHCTQFHEFRCNAVAFLVPLNSLLFNLSLNCVFSTPSPDRME